MNRTRIFVSSTFFDLVQVREDIRVTISQLGHEPLLNEYPSFPVLPDLDTIENCRKAVRGSDIFVLIVGGRRGSLDPVSGKSVTNVEYETAVQSGTDCFIFVNEKLMTLLPIWQKNPETDFSHFVDSPQVFEFIDKINTAQRWIFPYAKASQIGEILRIQLSVFLKSLLDRRKSGKLDPIKEFEKETERARQLALDRPPLWEYSLTEELLRSKLSVIKREYDDLNKGLLFRPGRTITAEEYLLSWIPSKLNDPAVLVEILEETVGRVNAAWGKPGEPGDALEILRSVNKMMETCQALLDWELELRSVTPPSVLKNLGASLHGLTAGIIDELKRISDELSKALEGASTGTGEVSILLKISAPPQLDKFLAEMKEVSKHPEWLSL
ncbi:MAG TPA: DUF4062 domain-containing protein [Terriglobales bacterium]|nr:DUF4062 domain-containing protein [Terriglobales bacterium]